MVVLTLVARNPGLTGRTGIWPEYLGANAAFVAIMIGVPTYWREQKNDSVSDPALHDLIRRAHEDDPARRFNSARAFGDALRQWHRPNARCDPRTQC